MSTLSTLVQNLPDIHPMFAKEESRNLMDSSKIQDYQSCPRKFFLRHILGWDYEVPSYHLHFGKAWHKGLEYLYSNGFSPEHVAQSCREFLKAYEEQEIELPSKCFKTPERAIEALFKYATKYASDFMEYDVVAVESPYTIPIEETRTLIVNRDVLARSKRTGAYVIIEHKTASQLGRTFSQPWHLSLQVAMYALSAYLETHGNAIPKVIVNATCFKSNETAFERVPVLRGYSGIMNALFTVNSIWTDIERDLRKLYTIDLEADFLMAFRQSPQACANYTGCQYFDYCSYCGNPLNLGGVPIGMVTRFWNPAEAYL